MIDGYARLNLAADWSIRRETRRRTTLLPTRRGKTARERVQRRGYFNYRRRVYTSPSGSARSYRLHVVLIAYANTKSSSKCDSRCRRKAAPSSSGELSSPGKKMDVARKINPRVSFIRLKNESVRIYVTNSLQ